MVQIPSANESPHIDEATGKISWYNGDTFTIDLTINLTDADSQPFNIGAEDKIYISFFDKVNLIQTFEFSNIVDNTVHINVDDEITKKFKPNKYTYCIKFNSEVVRTIGANCQVEVYSCH